MPHYQLISHTLCPYVQRVAILMQEKHIHFERTDIDLSNKPPWFLSLSPFAKVPVLVVDNQQSLVESQAICEFLDEVSNGSFYPSSAIARARHRALITTGDEILGLLAKIIYQCKTAEEIQKPAEAINEKLRYVMSQHSADRYFSGSEFYLIDGVYATIIRYFSVVKELFGCNFFADWPQLQHWYQSLSQRASVINAVPGDYQHLLREFIIDKSPMDLAA